MKVSSVTIKKDEILSIGEITVLVGPNNVGKSQTLRDILDIMENGKNAKPVIIKHIELDFPHNIENFIRQLHIKDSPRNVENKISYGLKSNLLDTGETEFSFEILSLNYAEQRRKDSITGRYTKYMVSYMNSSNRLQLANSVSSFDPSTENPQNLIQSLFLDKEKDYILMDAFQKAFNMEIRLDYSGMTKFSFRVAQKFPDIPEDPRTAGSIMKQFPMLENQGDGFRSLVGIILGLIYSENRVVLLDEPEAFLHPAQSRFLGKWIGDNKDLIKGQLLISTHNAHFLAGLIASGEDVDIYRLNRHGNTTDFVKITAENTRLLFENPLLSSQRVVESVFYKGVVVCEADADRAVYQGVCSINLNSTEDIQFINAQNKQTLAPVATLLHNANIPVVLIADIDSLNNEKVLSDMIIAQTGKEPEKALLDARKQIADAINGRSEEEIFNELKLSLTTINTEIQCGKHTLEGAKSAIKRVWKEASPWSEIKKHGIDTLEEPTRKIASGLLEELKKFGIFLVPVGELEGWIDLGTSDKKKWILKALPLIHEGKVPEPLQDFVAEILSHLSNISQSHTDS